VRRPDAAEAPDGDGSKEGTERFRGGLLGDGHRRPRRRLATYRIAQRGVALARRQQQFGRSLGERAVAIDPPEDDIE
jgi:hypothetical protein